MRSVAAKWGLPLVFVWLSLYPFPYFAEIRSANELPRIYLTRAIVEDGTFAIDSGVARWGSTADVSYAHGHHYSNKAPGSSFLAIPAYLLVKGANAFTGGEPTLAQMTWASRVVTGVLPTLLFLVLLWRFLPRFCRRPDARGGGSSPDRERTVTPALVRLAPARLVAVGRWVHRPLRYLTTTTEAPCDERNAAVDARRMALIGYGLGSMALTYSVLFIAHQLSAVCIGVAYVLLAQVLEDGRHPRWLLAAGAAAGCALLVDYQAAFAGVPLAVYAIGKLVFGARRRFGDLGLLVLGAVGPVALLLFYHDACFGSPFKTGYDFSQTFAHFHQQGFLGITALRWTSFVGSTVAPDNGLIVFCPMLLLALPGWLVLYRRGLYAHLGVTLAVVVIYLLFISSINFWRGGWQLGPRYITAMLPFALVPVTAALHEMARLRWTRAVAVALVTVGVVVYSVSCAVFPHFPEKFANPLYELVFRLIGDDLVAYNLGWIFGLRGVVSLLPYLAVLAAALIAMAGWRRGARLSAVVGLILAAVIIAGYGLFPDGGPAAERAYQWITTVMPR